MMGLVAAGRAPAAAFETTAQEVLSKCHPKVASKD